MMTKEDSWALSPELRPRTLLLGLLLLITCLYSLLARDSYGGDFRAYYVAADASRHHLDPYVNQVDVDERYADRDWLQVHSRFVYPPSSLLLFLPFAHLPYNAAKAAFGMLIALSMIAILLGLADRHPRAWWLTIGLFFSLPMAANIDNGQVDALVLALTLAVLWARKSWVAGLCLGVAIAIKFSPILLLGWLLATRRWKTATWGIVTAVAITALSVRLWGWGLYREFAQHLRQHLGANPQMLEHVFRDYRVFFGRFVVIGNSSYSLHYYYGPLQNPLHLLGSLAAPAGLLAVVIYLGWLALSARGRTLRAATSFYIFLIVALLANALLWPAGLVACFPLTILMVAKARNQVVWALALLAPFFLPLELIGGQRFVCWLAVAIACVFRDAWLRQVISDSQCASDLEPARA